MIETLRMTVNEQHAWRALLEAGAKPIKISCKPALDLSTIRVTSKKSMIRLPAAIVGVAAIGRKSANRRHVDRWGNPIFIVTDDEAMAADILRRVEIGKRISKGA